MSSNLDLFRKNAAAARAEADIAVLPNVRVRDAEAAAKWDEMADRLEWVEEQGRIKRQTPYQRADD